MLDHFAQSAKTLTLIAIIIQAVFTVFFAAYFIFFFGLITMIPATTTPPPNTVLLIFVVIGAVFGVIGLVWVLLDYFLVYKRISDENVIGAKDSALILGIIQLIFGGVVPGVLLIVAYTQLGNSMHFVGHQPQN